MFLDLQKAGFKIKEKGLLYGEKIKKLSEIEIKDLFIKEFEPTFNIGDKNENIKTLK